MLHNKFLNNNWARIPLFLLILIGTFTVLGGVKAHALQITAKFNDRATIEIQNIVIDDVNNDLSDEAKDAARNPDNTIDVQSLQTWANDQLKGIYSRHDLLGADKNYNKTGCENHNNILSSASEEGIDKGEFFIGNEHDGNVITGNFINHFWIQTKSPTRASKCVSLVKIQTSVKYSFQVANPDSANKVWFIYDTPADNKPVESIVRVDTRGVYKLSAPKRFQGTEQCNGAGDLENVILKSDLAERTQATFESCARFSNPFDVVVAKKGVGGAGGTIDVSGQAGTGVTCESSPFSLSWIFCPMINGLVSASDGLYDNVIKPALDTDSLNTNAQDPSNYTFKVWSSFRIFGNVLLVIGVLVIVFGEAIGGGLIDAYTAKKVLPRILVAAVLINLSFYICALAIDITNILGGGIDTLFTTMVGTANVHLTINGGGSGLGMAAILTGGGALLAGGGEALMVLFLFVLLPALLALLGVALTIIIRNGIILLLVIISPVAVALYCLPNTEKYAKQWFSLFIKTLMVYPIVAAIFGVANILALTINKANNSNGPAASFAGLVSVIVLIMPMFLIPYAFKLAGGAIGSLHDQFTNYRKRGHQGILGNANDQNSTRNRAMRNYGIRREVTGMTPGQVGTRLNPARLTKGGRERAAGRIRAQKQAGLEKLRKQTEGTALWQAGMQDSNITAALGLFENGHEARKAVDYWEAEQFSLPSGDKNKLSPTDFKRVKEQKMAAIGSAEKIGYNQSNRRAALLNSNTIGYELKGGEEGWNQAITAMDSIAAGDPFQFRSMEDEFQAIAKGAAGRADLVGNTSGERKYDLDLATGSQSLYALLNGKGTAVDALMKQHSARLLSTDPSITAEQREKSATFLHEMRNAQTKNQAVGSVRDKINENQATMQAAYDKYLQDQAAAASSAGALPATRDEVLQETVVNPVTGNEETRNVRRPVALTTPAEKEAAYKQLVEQKLEGLSRAYTPIDPNNRP